MGKTVELGAAGERVAVEWLRAAGFVIMDTNWRAGRYELDIVANSGDTVHFVEVKLRKAGSLTAPEDAMTPAKCRALLKAANFYIEQHGITSDCRIDMIAVEYDDEGETVVRYIPDAVTPGW